MCLRELTGRADHGRPPLARERDSAAAPSAVGRIPRRPSAAGHSPFPSGRQALWVEEAWVGVGAEAECEGGVGAEVAQATSAQRLQLVHLLRLWDLGSCAAFQHNMN